MANERYCRNPNLKQEANELHNLDRLVGNEKFDVVPQRDEPFSIRDLDPSFRYTFGVPVDNFPRDNLVRKGGFVIYSPWYSYSGDSLWTKSTEGKEIAEFLLRSCLLRTKKERFTWDDGFGFNLIPTYAQNWSGPWLYINFPRFPKYEQLEKSKIALDETFSKFSSLIEIGKQFSKDISTQVNEFRKDSLDKAKGSLSELITKKLNSNLLDI
ncbi:hypothetical protein KY343_02665 [Candidatus Woesearchaeota archaeon]|nr:hypothetical protein [Candidatus Woesearchaeota archaeon]